MVVQQRGGRRDEATRSERYLVLRELGRNGAATTSEALDVETGRPCVLRRCALRGPWAWALIERVEREARLLRAIDHGAVARYVDFFIESSSEGAAFVLVRERRAGVSLLELVTSGWRASEAQAIRIAEQLLDVRAHFEALRVPIAHGDLHPGHVVLDGGRVSLIDFGAAIEAPSEVERATELAAIGAVVVFALTGRLPIELGARVGVGELGVSPRFGAWLARVLAFGPTKAAPPAVTLLAELRPEGKKKARAISLAAACALGMGAAYAAGFVVGAGWTTSSTDSSAVAAAR